VVGAGCRAVILVSLMATASAALGAYPHQLAYFNEFHGGLWGGHERMLQSNVDWGQDWLLCRDALFGPTRSVPHDYPFVYTLEKSPAMFRECFRDQVDLRSAFADDPPGTPLGICIGWTLASEILHGPATGLSVARSDIGECIRRADGWTAVTPAIALFHCRTPG
jgi:hypothetical protein